MKKSLKHFELSYLLSLFAKISLILLLFPYSHQTQASKCLREEEQTSKKITVVFSEESKCSYGDFDDLSEDILFHHILPYCNENIITVNRAFFTLVTGYTAEHILDQGFESRPTRSVFVSLNSEINNKEINFKRLFYPAEKISSFVWYSLIRRVSNIPSKYWFYLKDTQIYSLDLSCNQIGVGGARALGQALNGTQVHTLDLSCNQIGAGGVRALALTLKDTKIHTFNLTGNQIGDAGVRDLGKILKDTQIHTLNLSCNQIGPVGALALALTLKDMKIHTFNLTGNQVGDAGVRDLGKILKDTQIHTLKLLNNKISDEGAVSLSQNFKDTKIHILDLRCNKIGDIGAWHLAQGIKGTQIHTLNLSLNQITGEMQKALRQMLPNVTLIFEN